MVLTIAIPGHFSQQLCVWRLEKSVVREDTVASYPILDSWFRMNCRYYD